MPSTAESEIAPGPGSKNGEQRQENPSAERLAFATGQLKKEANARTGDQRCQDAARKVVDHGRFLQKRDRSDAKDRAEGKD